MIVKVRFFSDTYRKTGPPFGDSYRPHLVVNGKQDYLGVHFINLPKVPFGESIICEIKLLYDDVDYSKLTTGTTFEIKEGPHIVGEGIVFSN